MTTDQAAQQTAAPAPPINHSVATLRAEIVRHGVGAERLHAALIALVVDHCDVLIYDECSHLHADDDPAVVVLGHEGTTNACTENPVGVVCRLCCAEQGEQSLECRETHHWHMGEDPVVCHVRKTIADALNGAVS